MDKKNEAIRFAEWLKINFDNEPQEVGSQWYDLFYIIDEIEHKSYTTEELYKWWSDNVNNK